MDGTLCIGLGTLALSKVSCIFELWQDSEIGLHGLEVFEIRVSNIMAKSTEHRRLWKSEGCLLFIDECGVDSGKQTGRDIAHISFYPGDLTCEKKIIVG